MYSFCREHFLETKFRRIVVGAKQQPMKTTLLAICAVLASEVVFAARNEIAQDRAHQLAASYFARYFEEGCGGVAVPTLRGSYWEAPIRLGFAGTLSGYIHVDRRSGTVSSDGHPTVSAQSLEAWSASLHKRAHKP